jgi:hypothetical protein
LARFVSEHNEIAEFVTQLQFESISHRIVTVSDLYDHLKTMLIEHMTLSDLNIRHLDGGGTWPEAGTIRS